MSGAAQFAAYMDDAKREEGEIMAELSREAAEAQIKNFCMDYRMKCDEETKRLHVALEQAEERERAAREALRALVDRNITFDDANAILPFETHDQAINHIEEARDIANDALRAGERT